MTIRSVETSRVPCTLKFVKGLKAECCNFMLQCFFLLYLSRKKQHKTKDEKNLNYDGVDSFLNGVSGLSRAVVVISKFV